MSAADFQTIARDALEIWARSRDELCELDGAIGDGDLGITISSGALAVIAAWDAEADRMSPSTMFRVASKAFAAANPSTMAALLSGAALGAARALEGVDAPTRENWTAALQSAIAVIERRGGAARGDKTILDAMWPALESISDQTLEDGEVLHVMIAAAADGVTATQGLQSVRGRAAWVGDRSIGQPDPGATAFLRLLQALEQASRI